MCKHNKECECHLFEPKVELGEGPRVTPGYLQYDLTESQKQILRDKTKKDATDKLFITEINNDLHRNGFVRGGKAETMLHDWAKELRENSRASFPASRLKKEFLKEIGLQCW